MSNTYSFKLFVTSMLMLEALGSSVNQIRGISQQEFAQQGGNQQNTFLGDFDLSSSLVGLDENGNVPGLGNNG